ncbi:MAG: hypothetical protein ACFB2Z_01825 [Maricaulaceae bacterium]
MDPNATAAQDTLTLLVIGVGGANDETTGVFGDHLPAISNYIASFVRSSSNKTIELHSAYLPWTGGISVLGSFFSRESIVTLDAIYEDFSKLPSPHVVFVGHSYGGDTAFHAVDRWSGHRIAELSDGVALLVTLDPVSSDAASRWADNDPYGPHSERRPERVFAEFAGVGVRSWEKTQSNPRPKTVRTWLHAFAVGGRGYTGGDFLADLGGQWLGEDQADANVPVPVSHEDVPGMVRALEPHLANWANTCFQSPSRNP